MSTDFLFFLIILLFRASGGIKRGSSPLFSLRRAFFPFSMEKSRKILRFFIDFPMGKIYDYHVCRDVPDSTVWGASFFLSAVILERNGGGYMAKELIRLSDCVMEV